MSESWQAPASGIESYDVARWTDWVPRIERTHSAGRMHTLLQLAPTGARGATETSVQSSDRHVLIFRAADSVRIDCRVAGRPHRIQMRSWDCIYLPPEADSWWATPPIVADNMFHLHLDRSIVDDFLNETASLPPMSAMINAADPGLSSIARMVFSELAVGTAPTQLAWDTCGAMLALRLVQLQTRSAPRQISRGLPAWRLKRVTDYLMSHLSDDVPLADVAAVADLSPHHFCRAFKQTTGLSPNAWLTARRMERAQALMAAHPKLGLTEIALCVGYQSQAAFGTAFKRVCGATPSQWRRERMG